MKKFLVFLTALLCAVLLVGGVCSASAAEVAEEPAQVSESGLAEEFIQTLRDRYGEQWETYYNAILDEWGTVEAFLLSAMPDGAPDVAKNGWNKFIDWTRENWVIIAAVGAVVLTVIVVLFGKNCVGLIVGFFKKMFSLVGKLFSGVNLLYKNAKAQNDALLALMGNNPRFSAQRDALNATNEEMMKDEEDDA